MDEMNRSLGIAATSREVIAKACKLDESLIFFIYRTGDADFWREACWLCIQKLILGRNYHNLTKN